LDKDSDGNLIRKSGIMGVILQSGEVKPGDTIRTDLPHRPFKKLERV
jgi:MOSC domain-containing protein YiiM